MPIEPETSRTSPRSTERGRGTCRAFRCSPLVYSQGSSGLHDPWAVLGLMSKGCLCSPLFQPHPCLHISVYSSLSTHPCLPVDSSLSTHPCLLILVYSSLSTHPCLLIPVYSSLSTHSWLLIPVYSSLSTHPCLLIPVYSSLPTHPCLLPSVYSSLSPHPVSLSTQRKHCLPAL